MKCPECDGWGIIDNYEGEGVCPQCNGKGEVIPFCVDVELDKLDGGVTNEEWLNDLAWDLKAYWLANTCGRAMVEYKNENNAEKMTLDYWKAWLKEKHNG